MSAPRDEGPVDLMCPDGRIVYDLKFGLQVTTEQNDMMAWRLREKSNPRKRKKKIESGNQDTPPSNCIFIIQLLGGVFFVCDVSQIL